VGFGGTGFYLVVPMYVAEIASNSVRGRLGSLMIFSKNLGLVIGYVINSYLDYYTVPFIVFTLLMVFFVGFQFVADSPKHLMVQQRTEGAMAALKFFRGYSKSDRHFSKEFHEEVAALRSANQTDGVEVSQKLTVADFCKLIFKLLDISQDF
jgi:MFS family permease